MGFWEAAVLIVAIVVIGKVMSGGRWNKQSRRWEKQSPDNPYVKMGLTDEAPALRKDIARLNDRVATLEKIVTEPGRTLSDEIERLRSLPPANRPEPRDPQAH